MLLCEACLHPGNWKDLIRQVALVSNPPCGIVGSRLADEDLSVAALGAGVFDVLAKPFNRPELLRTLAAAAHHWTEQFEITPRAMTAAG